MWRTRRKVTSSSSSRAAVEVVDGDVAQRRARRALGAPLAGCAPVAVAAGRVRVRDPRVDHEQLESGGGEAERRPARPRASGSRGTPRHPRRPSSDADWSMIPVGAPTATFSARWPTRASVGAVEAELPHVVQRDARTPLSIAADDDSPAPTGTSESSSDVEAGRRSVGADSPSSAQATPSGYAAQSGRIAAGRGEVGEVDLDQFVGRTSCRRAAVRSSRTRDARRRSRRSMANGSTKPSL